jgi:AmiR/NasT family two-component response regulator
VTALDSPSHPGEVIDLPALTRLTREQLIEEVTGLRRAIQTRAVIEQAKGIVMATCACGSDEAFQVLVAQSQHENRKVRDVAAELVAMQSRHARSAPSSGPDPV